VHAGCAHPILLPLLMMLLLLLWRKDTDHGTVTSSNGNAVLCRPHEILGLTQAMSRPRTHETEKVLRSLQPAVRNPYLLATHLYSYTAPPKAPVYR